jgi:hypothetical protein
MPKVVMPKVFMPKVFMPKVVMPDSELTHEIGAARQERTIIEQQHGVMLATGDLRYRSLEGKLTELWRA